MPQNELSFKLRARIGASLLSAATAVCLLGSCQDNRPPANRSAGLKVGIAVDDVSGIAT